MKLLFIFTGGTIGSTQKGEVIFADEAKSYQILLAYEKRYGIPFDYDVEEPYTELSENNTGKHIGILADCISNAAKKRYDGIIVTHGSDTLQYSAAAVGYALGQSRVPVCFVAANAPIESPHSNAMDNLRGAIRFVEEKGGNGVFVVYRNSASETVTVHRATRLLESRAYSDEVASVADTAYGWMDRDFHFVKNPDFRERADEADPLPTQALEAVNERVAVISAHPGLCYPALSKNVKYVIFNTYHSGTLDTKSEQAIAFFADAKRWGIVVFATGISEGPQYASAQLFEKLAIRPIINLSPVAAYVKIWLADSAGMDPGKLLYKSLAGDIF